MNNIKFIIINIQRQLFHQIRTENRKNVKIKTSEIETKIICIMKQTNIAITNIFLNNDKQAGVPVKVVSTKRVYFCHQHKRMYFL